jgi:hypothetical protein
MPDSPESLSKNRKWFLKKEIRQIIAASFANQAFAKMPCGSKLSFATGDHLTAGRCDLSIMPRR